MGLITNLFYEKRSDAGGIPIGNPTGWLRDLLHHNRSKAGIPVNEETAIQVMAVFVCVDIISKSIASLPKPIFKTTKSGREKSRDHPLWNLLNFAPNPEMTAYDFWKCLMVNVLLSKGGFAEIVRDGSGNIVEFWPIPGRCVTLDRNRNTKELMFHISAPDGRYYTLYKENILYIKGFTKDGLNSYLPVNIAREAIGLSTALEQFGEEFFANGANAGGIVEYPDSMSDKAFERYKSSFKEEFTGLGKSNRLIFLEDGAKYTQLTVPPNAGQFLESRKYQVVDICRFFGMPPHKAFEYDNVNYSTAEQANIEFVQTTLTPWAVNIEQAIWLYSLLPLERKKLYMKVNMNGLLRGDFKTRMEGYHYMRQDGVFTANNILELEDMDIIPEELGGDTLLVNGNMIPIALAGKVFGKQKGGENSDGRSLEQTEGRNGEGAPEQQPQS